MAAAILIGLCLLLGLFLLGRWFVSAEPKTIARVLKISGAVLLGVVVVVLAITGRLGVAIALLPLLVPFVLRWRSRARRANAQRAPQPGQTSDLRTDFLEVSLDHDTGAVQGRVRRGPFAGRTLDSLSLGELRTLHAACRSEDGQSATVLEAYLDRVHGAAWRDDAGRDKPQQGAGSRMTREEAFEVLGLEPEASPKEITDAHRRLMKKLHPDHGGSDYLAAKLNAARDVLLD